MRKWEDIVKDRLEGYESTLPEGSLAEFRSLRDTGGATPKRRAYPLVWASAIAVAAGLAAVLLLRHPGGPENSVQVTPQPPVAQVQAHDTADVATPVLESPLLAQAVVPKASRPVPVQFEEEVIIEETEPEEVNETEPVEESVAPEVPRISSPFVPVIEETKPVKMNLGPAAGAIAGVGLLSAAPFVVGKPVSHGDIDDTDSVNNAGSARHGFPLITGLSTRIPIIGRLSVTTGLEYSLYPSWYTNSLSRERRQFAHYLGIPVRLDWSIVSGRWLDCYLGAGVKGDFCMGATLNGEAINKKDGPALMLLGVGGLQIDATRRLGIFVEPEISWTVPSERQVLATYRSEHPLMFTVATGLRINLGK